MRRGKLLRVKEKENDTCSWSSALNNSPPENSVQDVEGSAAPKGRLLIKNRGKVIRLRNEKNFKVLEWKFDQPSAEHIEQLHLQFTVVAKPSLCTMLFSKDFKQQLKALDLLNSLAVEDPDAIVANSDILLKWISLRFFETSQQVLLKALDLAVKIFAAVQREPEPLSDIELTSFVPYLVTKLGEVNGSIRDLVKKVIFLLVEIAGPARILPFVVDALSIKNSRLRTHCLEVVRLILDSNGLSETSITGKSLEAIGACISDRDSSVRNAAINAVVAAYKGVGENLFQMIGRLSAEDKAILEGRTKKFRTVSQSKGGKVTIRKRSASGKSGGGLNLGVGSENFDDAVSDDDKDRTYTVENDDGDKLEAEGRQHFHLNLKALWIDPKSPSHPQFQNDKATNPLSDHLNVPLQRHTQSSLFRRESKSVCATASPDSYTSSDIDKAIHCIASLFPALAMKGLSELQCRFQEPGFSCVLAMRIDAIIQAVVTQTALIRSHHLNDFIRLDEVNDLIGMISGFLCSVITEHNTCGRITTESLKMLIEEIFYLLNDERLKRLKDVSKIVKSLNCLTTVICDNADPTFCYLALVSILASALRNPQIHTAASICKCINEHSNQFLCENFAKETPMDLDSVMLATHEFVEEFKSRTDERSTVEEAISCIETCIQRLTVAYGASILDHFSKIIDPEKSKVVDYARKCVQSWETSRTSSKFSDIPKQVTAGDSLQNLVNGFLHDPFGKGFEDLLKCVRNDLGMKDSVDEMLKEKVEHKAFFHYHLKKALADGSDKPNLLPETRKAAEFLRSVEASLKDFHETGVWDECSDTVDYLASVEPEANNNEPREGNSFNG